MNLPTKNRLKRFSTIQRLFHLGLMLCFAHQAATGLARMFTETYWGQKIASVFGGYAGALHYHKIVGLIMLGLFVLHVLYIFTRINWKGFPSSLIGPDSLLPRPADVSQFFRHSLWIIGLGKAPEFDRWTYWEKFDYWAVFWGMVIIGGSGLILYNPVVSSTMMPGWSINLAFWVHRIEAVLAIGHVFIIHFFIAHLRRENFPMDDAIFQGGVDLEKARHERSAWVKRLEESDRLTGALTQGAPLPLKAVSYCFGLAMVVFCLYLLIGGLMNVSRVTW